MLNTFLKGTKFYIMRKFVLYKLILLLIVAFLIVSVYKRYENSHVTNLYREVSSNTRIANQTYSEVKKPTKIFMSLVVCDSRFNESLNAIKSALLFTRSPIYFIIFTDKKLWSQLNAKLNEWKLIRNQFDFELRKISFPKGNEDLWLNLFSKCAAQRLFIPTLLSHIDALIYVDIDTLFLGSVDELWNFFNSFNTSQISAMALEDSNPSVSWYPRFAKHPFYGKFGLNSGVMLMNLTRMRSFGWVNYVTPIMLTWRANIPWGDQDIINILFHYHEAAVYVLSCRYNYRSDQCMYGDACADATEKGVFILHGSRKAFQSHKQPAFNAIYTAMSQYELYMDPKILLNKMRQYLKESPESNCGSLHEAFLKVPNETINKLYGIPKR